MSDVVHRAYFRVPPNLLPKVMGLPEGTTVDMIQMDWMMNPPTATFYVTHPDLPSTPMGAMVPEVCPTFELTKFERVQMISWGTT